jgi:hypothetical protein
MKKIYIIIILFLIFSLLFWFLFQYKKSDLFFNKKTKSQNQSSMEDKLTKSEKTVFDKFKIAYSAPIVFYGVVYDQDGNPVQSAKVAAKIKNKIAKSSLYETMTDANGKFSISESGLGLYVSVSKSGYYDVYDDLKLKSSRQGFYYGADLGYGIHKPNKSEPVVFQIRKEGNPILLEEVRAGSKLPKDGTLTIVKSKVESRVHFNVGCLTQSKENQPTALFDWECKVSVENGVIQECNDAFDFMAPEEGYSRVAVISMPSSLGDNWSDIVKKYYWIKLENNTYAKVLFKMIAFGDHFCAIEGHHNPTPGDRNLEPKK